MAPALPTSSATSAARSCSRSSRACSPPGTRPRAGALISSSGKDVTASTQAELTKSFSSAADTASRLSERPAGQIIAGAKTAFLDGDQWAYTAGIVAVLVGAALVFFLFPRAEEEKRLLDLYHEEDREDAGRERPVADAARPLPTS
jgi:hypothetical protein